MDLLRSEPDPDPNTDPNLSLLRRGYHTISLPATYGRLNTSPPPGIVVAIVLGSVAGFILCLYLLYLILNAGRGSVSWTSASVSEEVVMRRRPSRRRGRRHSSDIIEVEEEERSRERERYRPAPPRKLQRSRGWRRGQEEHIVVDESTEGTDVIEVVEEEEERRRPGKRRTGSRRTFDPMAYGGSD